MIFQEREGRFQSFFDNRSSLIIQYANGDISKREFLEYNFDIVQNMNVKPFLSINSYEEGMYNYQYYNVLAKYYNMLAKDVRRSKLHRRYHLEYKNMATQYYNEKDKATLQLLEYLKFANVEAYFIEVESKFLQDKLYEIVLLNYDEAIFHSKSLELLEILKVEGVFIEDKRVSLIDEYINERY